MEIIPRVCTERGDKVNSSNAGAHSSFGGFHGLERGVILFTTNYVSMHTEIHISSLPGNFLKVLGGWFVVGI